MSDSTIEKQLPALSTDELSQIISAILDGKYSLACALFLRFNGYDPSDYIPYRTYIRLVKETCHKHTSTNQPPLNSSSSRSFPIAKRSSKKSKIRDLNHIEYLQDHSSDIIGGGQLFHYSAGTFAGEIIDSMKLEDLIAF
jgi:hypothetical protein